MCKQKTPAQTYRFISRLSAQELLQSALHLLQAVM